MEGEEDPDGDHNMSSAPPPPQQQQQPPSPQPQQQPPPLAWSTDELPISAPQGFVVYEVSSSSEPPEKGNKKEKPGEKEKPRKKEKSSATKHGGTVSKPTKNRISKEKMSTAAATTITGGGGGGGRDPAAETKKTSTPKVKKKMMTQTFVDSIRQQQQQSPAAEPSAAAAGAGAGAGVAAGDDVTYESLPNTSPSGAKKKRVNIKKRPATTTTDDLRNDVDVNNQQQPQSQQQQQPMMSPSASAPQVVQIPPSSEQLTAIANRLGHELQQIHNHTDRDTQTRLKTLEEAVTYQETRNNKEIADNVVKDIGDQLQDINQQMSTKYNGLSSHVDDVANLVDQAITTKDRIEMLQKSIDTANKRQKEQMENLITRVPDDLTLQSFITQSSTSAANATAGGVANALSNAVANIPKTVRAESEVLQSKFADLNETCKQNQKKAAAQVQNVTDLITREQANSNTYRNGVMNALNNLSQNVEEVRDFVQKAAEVATRAANNRATAEAAAAATAPLPSIDVDTIRDIFSDKLKEYIGDPRTEEDQQKQQYLEDLNKYMMQEIKATHQAHEKRVAEAHETHEQRVYETFAELKKYQQQVANQQAQDQQTIQEQYQQHWQQQQHIAQELQRQATQALRQYQEVAEQALQQQKQAAADQANAAIKQASDVANSFADEMKRSVQEAIQETSSLANQLRDNFIERFNDETKDTLGVRKLYEEALEQTEQLRNQFTNRIQDTFNQTSNLAEKLINKLSHAIQQMTDGPGQVFGDRINEATQGVEELVNAQQNVVSQFQTFRNQLSAFLAQNNMGDILGNAVTQLRNQVDMYTTEIKQRQEEYMDDEEEEDCSREPDADEESHPRVCIGGIGGIGGGGGGGGDDDEDKDRKKKKKKKKKHRHKNHHDNKKKKKQTSKKKNSSSSSKKKDSSNKKGKGKERKRPSTRTGGGGGDGDDSGSDTTNDGISSSSSSDSSSSSSSSSYSSSSDYHHRRHRRGNGSGGGSNKVQNEIDRLKLRIELSKLNNQVEDIQQNRMVSNEKYNNRKLFFAFEPDNNGTSLTPTDRFCENPTELEEFMRFWTQTCKDPTESLYEDQLQHLQIARKVVTNYNTYKNYLQNLLKTTVLNLRIGLALATNREETMSLYQTGPSYSYRFRKLATEHKLMVSHNSRPGEPGYVTRGAVHFNKLNQSVYIADLLEFLSETHRFPADCPYPSKPNLMTATDMNDVTYEAWQPSSSTLFSQQQPHYDWSQQQELEEEDEDKSLPPPPDDDDALLLLTTEKKEWCFQQYGFYDFSHKFSPDIVALKLQNKSRRGTRLKCDHVASSWFEPTPTDYHPRHGESVDDRFETGQLIDLPGRRLLSGYFEVSRVGLKVVTPVNTNMATTAAINFCSNTLDKCLKTNGSKITATEDCEVYYDTDTGMPKKPLEILPTHIYPLLSVVDVIHFLLDKVYISATNTLPMKVVDKLQRGIYPKPNVNIPFLLEQYTSYNGSSCFRYFIDRILTPHRAVKNISLTAYPNGQIPAYRSKEEALMNNSARMET